MMEQPGDTRDARRVKWAELSDAIGGELSAYFESKGRRPDDPATAATVRTNTTLVPKRGDNVLLWLEKLADISSVEGSRLVELGAGFGALAAYFAAQGADVTAVDINPEYVDFGSRVAARLHLGGCLAHVLADMRDLSALEQGSYDIVVVNNAFIYVTGKDDADEALRQSFDLLKPGGVVVFHHANKWRWREPFTRDPIVHLLPASVARATSRFTGWEHNHGRVRLQSPTELRRRLRRAGFRDVVVGEPRLRSRGVERYLAHFYVIAARRPA